MTKDIIIYGISLSLVGISFSIVLAAFRNSFKASNNLLIFSTVVGFLSGLGYMFNFTGQELVIAQFSTLFDFKLTLNFLSAIFFVLVNGIASLVLLYGSEYLKRYQKTYDIETVQFLTGFFILGMVGVLLASNVIGFMIFWEMMSIASFFLVMSDKTKESARAAFIYFVMTHLGAAAILGGFLILSHGSLAFGLDNIGAVSGNISPAMLSVSLLLFLFGFGSKAGLIPFHIWLPEAHPQAPTNISALMSGLMLKVAVYGFLKIILAVSGVPLWIAVLVIVLGIASAFFGALYAALGKDIKRAFAYSSIENMGIIFTMLGVALYIMAKNSSPEAMVLATLLVAYAIFHAINHAIFKTGLFLSSGVIISKVHSKSLEVMGGFAKAMPFFSFVFLIVILGSAALPPFGAFYGEWGFIRALIQALSNSSSDTVSLAIFLILLPLFALVSGLVVFAMIRIFSISMLGLPRTKWHVEDNQNDDTLLVAPIAILGLLILLLGFSAKYILDFLAQNIQQFAFAKTETVPGAAISSSAVFGFFLLFLVIAAALYKIFSNQERRERNYHTWDCGQPIDATMEYTATAFAGPIRFFFLPLLRRIKNVTAAPVIETNPWIVKKSFSLALASAWQEKVYNPVSEIILWVAEKIRLIHTGRIQYYLLLILATVIITLMIAL